MYRVSMTQNCLKDQNMQLVKVYLPVLAAPIFLLLACTASDSEIDLDALSIKGIIIEVQSQSLLETKTIILLDNSGLEHVIHLDGAYGKFTPAHLRDHMITAAPISVDYQIRDGKLTATAIHDDEPLVIDE